MTLCFCAAVEGIGTAAGVTCMVCAVLFDELSDAKPNWNIIARPMKMTMPTISIQVMPMAAST